MLFLSTEKQANLLEVHKFGKSQLGDSQQQKKQIAFQMLYCKISTIGSNMHM